MIELRFYNNIAEFNRVDKTNYLTEVTSLYGVLKEPVSITEPVISIEYELLPHFNYVYIPEFNRYYFIDDYVIDVNNIYILKLSIDVLMSYKQGILGTSAFITRTEHINYTTSGGALFGRQVDNKRVIIEGYDIDDKEISNDVFLDDANPVLPDNYTASFVLTGYKIYSGT